MYKVLIVDDEAILRKSLIRFVDWASLQCEVAGEAENGLEAMQLLQSMHIDILVTDIRMPGMDGIELTRHVHENHPHIRTVILTAHADFTYSQSAIRYDVVDFILKANPIEKLPDAIRKATAFLARQREVDDRQLVLQATLQEQFLKDVLGGIVLRPQDIRDRAAALGMRFDRHLLILFSVSHSADNPEPEEPEAQNRFIMSLRNFLSLAFKSEMHHTLILSRDMLATLVLCPDQADSTIVQAMLDTCKDVLSMVDCFMKFTVRIGISTIHRNFTDVPRAQEEALEAMNSRSIGKNHVALFGAHSAPAADEVPALDDKRFHTHLLAHLQDGAREQAQSCLVELFEAFRQGQTPLEQIKVSCLLLCAQCWRLFVGFSLTLPPELGDESDIYLRIQRSETSRAVFKHLSVLVQTMADLILACLRQGNHVIREVNQHIATHYNQNITLQSVADAIHISSSYLSRLYRRETGESFIDALNGFRIEKAKLLLRNPANRIYEIAGLVGIEDSGYFTHVFRKYTGLSPKEFRNHPSGG